MKNSIRLSPNHGVNPSITKCFLCGEDKNELVLFGKLKGDAEAPRSVVLDKEPCDKCKEYMQKGIILISVDEFKSKGDTENPYRSGGWVVVKDDVIKRAIAEPDDVLKERVAFITDDVWDQLGLPRSDSTS